MKKNQCKDALDIYKKFLYRMTKLSEFLKVAEVPMRHTHTHTHNQGYFDMTGLTLERLSSPSARSLSLPLHL